MIHSSLPDRADGQEVALTIQFCDDLLEVLSHPDPRGYMPVAFANLFRLMEMYRYDAWEDGKPGWEARIKPAMELAHAKAAPDMQRMFLATNCQSLLRSLEQKWAIPGSHIWKLAHDFFSALRSELKRDGRESKAMAQSNREKQEAFRARQAMLGQTEVRGIFLPPDMHAQLKEMARKLLEQTGHIPKSDSQIPKL